MTEPPKKHDGPIILLCVQSLPGSEGSDLGFKPAGPPLPSCTLTVWVPASNLLIPIVFSSIPTSVPGGPPVLTTATAQGDASEPCEGHGLEQSPSDGTLDTFHFMRELQKEKTASMRCLQSF